MELVMDLTWILLQWRTPPSCSTKAEIKEIELFVENKKLKYKVMKHFYKVNDNFFYYYLLFCLIYDLF